MLEVAISCSNVSINWLNRKQKSNLTQRQGGKKTKEKDKKKKTRKKWNEVWENKHTVWEILGGERREKWAGGDSRLKEKSFLPLSQGQLSRSAWTALERTRAVACWSKIWDLAQEPMVARSMVIFLFPSHNQLVESHPNVYDPVKPYYLMKHCRDFWTSVICGSWIWGQRSEDLGEPGGLALCQCCTLVRMLLSYSVWTLSLPPAPRVTLNSPGPWDLAHTSQGHTWPWEGISFKFSLYEANTCLKYENKG